MTVPVSYTPDLPRSTVHWPVLAILYGALLLFVAGTALSYALDAEQTYVLTARSGKVRPNPPLDALYTDFALEFLDLTLTATPQTYDARSDYAHRYALPEAAEALLTHPLLAPRGIATSPIFGAAAVTPTADGVAVTVPVTITQTLGGQTVSSPCTAIVQITAVRDAAPRTYRLRVMTFQLTVNT